MEVGFRLPPECLLDQGVSGVQPNRDAVGTITENSHKNSMLLILARPLLLWLRQHERSTREVEMSVSKNQKVHGVIHTASAASAGVGAGLAQIPGADAPVIAGIQTTMIIGI